VIDLGCTYTYVATLTLRARFCHLKAHAYYIGLDVSYTMYLRISKISQTTESVTEVKNAEQLMKSLTIPGPYL